MLTDDNIESISTIEANSSPIEQPPVIEEVTVPEPIVPVSMPVPEEIQDVITSLVTRTEVQQTLISQREPECPSSPSTTYMDSIEPENDKSAQTEDVEFTAVEDVRPETENENEMTETLNQRQEEEEEETQWEEKSKEEEEESKDGDNGKEEEEESREEEAKPPEAKDDQEEMEKSNIMEAGEGEQSKEEESNPVAEDNSQEMHNPPLEQVQQMDIDHEQDDQTLGNNADADLGMETESEIAATPAPEVVSPSSLNPGEAVDDEPRSVDEPVIFTRREHAKISHIWNADFCSRFVPSSQVFSNLFTSTAHKKATPIAGTYL